MIRTQQGQGNILHLFENDAVLLGIRGTGNLLLGR